MKKSEKYFVNVDRFNEAKKNCISRGENVSDRALASVLGITPRAVQQYRATVNQRPIPEVTLNMLASFLDVTPGWLCGLCDDISVGMPLPFDVIMQGTSTGMDLPLDIHTYVVKKKISDAFGRSIKGKPVSLENYKIYLSEVENAIDYITERFVANLENMK